MTRYRYLLGLFFLVGPAFAYLLSNWTPQGAAPVGWNLDTFQPASHFDGGQLQFRIITTGSHAITDPARQSNIMNAFQSWEDVPDAVISFTRGPDGSDDTGFSIGFATATGDTQWGANIAGAAGLASISFVGSDIVDADIAFSIQNPAPPASPWGEEFEATAVHEGGHAIGLEHSPHAQSPMSYIGPISGVDDQPVGRRLTSDDILALAFAYPNAGYHGSVGTISGTIKDGQGGDIHKAQIGVFDGSDILVTTTLSRLGRYRVEGLPPGNYTLRAYPSQTLSVLLQRDGTLPWTGDGAATQFLIGNDQNTTVTAGNTSALNLVVTQGTPTLESQFGFRDISGALIGGGFVFTLDRGEMGTLGISGTNFPTQSSELTNFQLSGPPGEVVLSNQAFPRNFSDNTVSYDLSVGSTAALGARALLLETNTSEETAIWGFLEVTDTGAISAARGANDPPGGSINPSTRKVMQQFAMSATTTEMVRLRQFTVTNSGSGSSSRIQGVEIFHDRTGNGLLEGDDELIGISDFAGGSTTVVMSAHSVPAGGTHDFLVVYTFDGSVIANETYQSSITVDNVSGVASGRDIAPSNLPQAGNTHTVGGTQHTISFLTSGNGGLAGPILQLVNNGTSSLGVSPLPDINHYFSGWTGDVTSSDDPLVIGNVTHDMTITANFSFGIANFPYGESFEGAFGVWENITGDNFDWIRQTGATPSHPTGPNAAADGSYYIFTDAFGHVPSQTAIVRAPFSFSQLGDPKILFHYHMFGADMGSLFLESSTDGGENWNTIWSKSGDQTDTWHPADISLGPLAGAGDVLLQFRAVMGSGAGYLGDIAIDNIEVTDNQALTLVIDQASISENGGAGTATVTRSGDTNNALNVNLQSSDLGEATVPPSITIPAAATSTTFNIAAVDDTLLDGSQTVTIQATATNYAPGQDTIDISDEETLGLSLNLDEVSEDSGFTNATVTRNNTDRGVALVVTLSSSDTSEASVPATVTIAAGQGSANFTVNAVDDTLLDGPIGVTITASHGSYANTPQEFATILDHETVTVTLNEASMSEFGGSSNATVTRSNTDNTVPLLVSLTADDPTEASTPIDVTIPANETSVNFTVNAVDDAVVDGTQTVPISPEADGYVPIAGFIDVTDHEQLVVDVAAPDLSEADSPTTLVTVTRTDLNGALNITIGSSDTSEATVAPTNFTILNGQPSGTALLTAIDDNLLDGTQTVAVSAIAVGYIAGQDTIDITDFETLNLLAPNPNLISEKDGRADAQLIRSATDVATTVTLTSSDTSEATVPPTFNFLVGQASTTITITAVDDNIRDGMQNVTITPSAAGYFATQNFVDVDDHETLTVSITFNSISENAGTSQATVTRSNTDNTASLEVFLNSLDPSEVFTPASVTIPAGQASTSFIVTGQDDFELDGTQTTTIEASAGGYITGSDTVDVTDYEELMIYLWMPSVNENDPGQIVMQVDRPQNSGPLSVNLLSSDTGEGIVPPSFTILDGEYSGTSVFTAVDDTILDGPQTVTVTASSPGYVNGQGQIDVLDVEELSVQVTATEMSEFGGSSGAIVKRHNTDIGAALTVMLHSDQQDDEANVPFDITIPAGQSTAVFTVTAVDDALLDGAQTANIGASHEDYVNSTPDSIDVTDHETVAVSIVEAAMSESGGSSPATVSLSVGVGPLVVDLASSDPSEATVPATVTIPAAQTSTTFNVTTSDDSELDGTQAVTITASAPGYKDGADTIDVTDHEILTLAPALLDPISESGAVTTTMAVSRSATAGTQVINLSSSDTGEVTVPPTYTFSAGSATGTIVLTSVDDSILDGMQTATIAISAAGYSGASQPIGIADHETLSVSIQDASMSEDLGSSSAIVTRHNTDIGTSLTVLLSVDDPSEGSVPFDVTIPANSNTISFTVTAQDDFELDGTQTLTVSASHEHYVPPAEDSILVTDSEDLFIGPDISGLPENGGASTIIRVNRTDTTGALAVTLNHNDPSEVSLNRTNFTILDGESEGTAVLTTVDDTLLDGTQSITLTATAAGYNNGQFPFDVFDHETLDLSIADSAISEFGGATTGTVTRNNTDITAAYTVNLSSTDISAATVPGSVEIPANQSSANFAITAADDTLLDGTQSITIDVFEPAYEGANQPLDVTDHETLTVTVNPLFISEDGAASSTGTVTRSNTDNGSPLVVALASDDIGEATVPASVTILAGQSSVTFAISAVDDAIVDGTQTVTITPSAAGYVSVPGTVDITDDAVTVTMVASPPAGGNVTGPAPATVDPDAGPFAISASPNLGYTFESWATTNGTIEVNNLDDLTANATVTATFNHCPIANDDSGTIGEDNVANIAAPGLIGNDIDNDDPLFVASFTQPPKGQVTVNTDGSFVYDPFGQFEFLNTGETRTDHFTYTLSDGACTSVGSVVITVHGVNDCPVAAPDSAGTPEDQPLSVNVPGVLGNDSDVDNPFPTASGPVTTVPPGLNPGDPYRLVFFTAGTRDATSPNIVDYNIFVTDQANLNPTLTGLGTQWAAVASTATVNARTNTNTDPTPAGPTGVPIYNLNGVRIANDYDDLWDGNLLAGITHDQNGDTGTVGAAWTGSTTSGLANSPLGAGAFSDFGQTGFAGTNWINASNDNNPSFKGLYGMSGILTVPTPPAVIANTNGIAGGLVTVASNGAFSYDPNGAFDSLNFGETATDQFTYTLSDGTCTVIGTTTVLITGQETLQVVITESALGEDGARTSIVTVSRAGTSGALGISLLGNDPSEATVTPGFTILDGANSATGQLTTVDDSELDGTQTVTVTASAAGYKDGADTIDITDHETLSLDPALLDPITENGGATTTMAVFRSASAGSQIINLLSSDTSEITVPPTYTFADGVSTGSIVLTSVDDTLLDGTQTANITISAPGYANSPSQPIDIADHETLSVSIQDASMSEAGGSSSATVFRNNSDLGAPLTVQLAVDDPSEGSVPFDVTIPANSNSATFTVTAQDDFELDGDQTLNVLASHEDYEPPASDSITVIDSEDLTVFPDFSSLLENDLTPVVVRVFRTDSTGPLAVTLNHNDASEVSLNRTNFTILDGELEGTAVLTTVDDSILDGNQTVTLTATAAGYNNGSAPFDVGDHETLTLALSKTAISEFGGAATGTVTRNNTDITAAYTVDLSSFDTSEATVPPSVEIPAGQPSANFAITAVDDDLLDGTQTVTIDVSSPDYVGDNKPLDVTDYEKIIVSVAPGTISESGGTAVGTLSRTNTDNTAPLVVDLASDDESEATVPAQVTIPAAEGSTTFLVTAVDDSDVDGTKTATITPSAANYVPLAFGVDVADDAVTVTMAATPTIGGNANGPGTVDPDAGPFAISATPNPGYTFESWATTNGTIEVNSLDDLTANATVTATFNHCPIANDDTGTVGEDQVANITAPGLVGNDIDNDDPLFVSSFTQPAKGQVTVNTNGAFVYDTFGQFEFLDVGETKTDRFTYTLNDGSCSSVASVVITVHGANDCPIALADSATTNEDTSTIGNAQANDSDIDVEPLISGSPLGALGHVTLAADGAFTYNPNGQFNDLDTGESATDSFTYVLDDGTCTVIGTAVITIHGANDCPIALADSANTDEDSAVVGDVQTNDSDPDLEPLTSSNPQGAVGMVTLSATGPFTYDPNGQFEHLDTGESATDAFTYILSDGTCTVVGTAVVTVHGANDCPIALADSATTNEDTTAAGNVLTNDSDVDVELLTSWNPLGAIGQVTLASNGAFTYDPDGQFNHLNLGETATDAFTYVLDDGTCTVIGTAVVVVHGVEALQVAIVPGVLGEAGAQTRIVTVTRAGSSGSLPITLVSNDLSEATVTTGFMILDGANSATGVLTSVDDTILDGTQTVTITASAPDYLDGQDTIDILDHESLRVEVAPGSISENGGSAVGTVTRQNTDHAAPLTVDLASSDLSEATVPAQVTILAAQGSATFAISAVDDALLDGTQVAAISVSHPDYSAFNNDAINITDHETIGISIAPGSMPENGGSAVGIATRSNTNTGQALVVGLLSSDLSEATVPASVTIAAAQTSATFAISAANDTIVDNTQTVTISGSAANYSGGSDDIDVLDDPVTVTVIASPPAGGSVQGPSPATVDPDAGPFLLSAVPNPGYVFVSWATTNGSIDSNELDNLTANATVTATFNHCPIANPDGAIANEDSVANIAAPGVLSNDVDNDSSPIVIANGPTTQGGIVTMASSGAFSYDPAGRFESLDDGETATDSFSYTISDGLCTSVATVRVVIHGANDCPTANPDGGGTDEATPVSIGAPGLLANDADPDVEPLTVIAHSQGSNGGQVNIAADGAFSYDPAGAFDALNFGETATDIFSYTMSDGDCTSVGTVRVVIAGVETLQVVITEAALSEEGSQTSIVTVSRAGTTGSLDIGLVSNDIGEAIVTPSFTILNGANSATGLLTTVDDALLDGDQTVTLTASAVGYEDGIDTIDVIDYETLAVAVAPPTISENGGTSVGTVTRSNIDRGDPLVVNLSSDDISEATVPAQVTIPAAQGSTTFLITAVDDAILDGMQPSDIVPSAPGYVALSDGVNVSDFEELGLIIDVPSIREDGQVSSATITRTDPTNELIVSLASNDLSELSVPASVTIPAGQGSSTFNVTAIDDGILDDTQTVTVTASAAGWESAIDSIDVTDHETLTIAVEINEISEDGGSATATLTRSDFESEGGGPARSSPFPGPITVNLASSDITEATVPAQVTIPDREQSVDFTITAVDDSIVDGTQTVTITASLGGYLNGNQTIDITDDAVTVTMVADPPAGGSVTGPDPATVDPDAEPFAISAVPNAGYTFSGWSTTNGSIAGNDLSGLSVNATVTGHFNFCPVSSDDSGTVSEDAPGEIAILANDTDADDPLVITSHTPAGQGTVILTTRGSFIYDPASKFEPLDTGESALDSFNYTLDDGECTDVATVTITIHGRNDCPKANDDSGVTNEDAVLTVQAPGVLGNDLDIDGEAHTVIANTNGSQGGLATVASDGSFSYDPNGQFDALNLGQTATDEFSYTMTDGDCSQVATVRIVIHGGEAIGITIAAPALPEHGGGTTDVTVSRAGTAGALIVNLANNDASEASVASTVTIPDGQTSASTQLTAVDDNLLDGTQTVTITATAPAYLPNADSIDILDHETLTVSIAASAISENGGSAVATVARSNTDNGALLLVNLGSSDISEATVPASVTIPAAQTSTTFAISAVDDPIIDGTQSVNITPSAPGYAPIIDSVDITDDAVTVTMVAAPAAGGAVNGPSNVDPSAGPFAISATPNPGYVFVGWSTNNGSVTGNSLNGLTANAIVTGSFNHCPLANDDSATAGEDAIASVPAPGVLANDVDSDDPLTVISKTNGIRGGIVVVATNGGFVYNPNAQFEALDDGETATDVFTYTISDGVCSDVGTVVVTVHGANDCPDAIADSASTNANATVTGDVEANDVDADDETLTASNAQGAVGVVSLATDGSYTYDPNGQFDCVPVGETATDSFTYVISDGTCTDVGTAVIVIHGVPDILDPLIGCPANITVNNDAGICGAIVTYTAPVGTDDCPGAVTTQIAGLGSGATFPVGTTTETYKVTDASGNSSSCSFTVTVIDNEAPSITCPANITVNNDTGNCSAVVTYTPPAGTDNCPGAVTTLIAGLGSGAAFPIGVTTEVYRVVDASGNSSSCSFTVTVIDNEAPSITCPANITVNNDTGICGAIVTYTPPTGTDNCPGAVATQTAGLGSGATFPLGVTTETYTVTDASGNSSSCSFTVTVIDNEAPSITCPANITVNNDTGICGAIVTYTPPAGTDNCPGAVTTQTAGLGSGATFPLGITTETYTVTDASGNFSSCSFTVTVIDNEAPSITCPANITVNNDTGICGAVVTYTPPSGTDNCPGAVTTLKSGLGSGAIFPTGTSTEVYEVTDASGNSTTCSFTITVVGCPSDIAVAITETAISEAGGVASGLVTRSAAGPALTVTLLNSNPSAATAPASVTIPLGQISAPFTVTAINDSLLDGTQSLSITPQTDGVSGIHDNLDVLDNPVTITVVAAPPVGGNVTGSGTVDPEAGPFAISATPNATHVFTGWSTTHGTIIGNSIDGLTANATVTATFNARPLVADDSYTTLEDTPLTGDVSDNDSDPEGDATTYHLVSRSGQLTLNTDGSFSYVPEPNFHGQVAFTYRANDGADSATNATITIDVISVNDCPVADDQSIVLGEDDDVRGQLTAIDVEGLSAGGARSYDALSSASQHSARDALESASYGRSGPFSALAPPTHGALEIDPTGSFSYSTAGAFSHLAVGETATDVFTFLVSDGECSDVGTVVLTVHGANDPPTTVADSATTDEDTSFVFDLLANDEDIDSPLTLVSWTSPNYDGMTYTPMADFHGQETFVYEVNDGVTGVATVTVRAINDLPVNTALPVITGIAAVGETVGVTPGIWNDDEDVNPGSIALSYQWLRDGADILGAVGSSYTLVAADIGTALSVRETATNTGEGTPVTVIASVESAPRASGWRVRLGTPARAGSVTFGMSSGASVGADAFDTADNTPPLTLHNLGLTLSADWRPLADSATWLLRTDSFSELVLNFTTSALPAGRYLSIYEVRGAFDFEPTGATATRLEGGGILTIPPGPRWFLIRYGDSLSSIYTLRTGYNLISFPYQPDGNARGIFIQEGQHIDLGDLTYVFGGEDRLAGQVEAYRGYWLFTPRREIVRVEGIPAPRTLTIAPGWNSVGVDVELGPGWTIRSRLHFWSYGYRKTNHLSPQRGYLADFADSELTW